MKTAIKHLVDIPESLKTEFVLDQYVFVKKAIKNVSEEALIGLVLTGVMILVFPRQPARHDRRGAFRFRSRWWSAS